MAASLKLASRSDKPSVWRVLVFAVLGGLVGLGIGLVAIALAPENGFGDLAAAAVTRVFLIPVGLVAGGVVGWFTGRR